MEGREPLMVGALHMHGLWSAGCSAAWVTSEGFEGGVMRWFGVAMFVECGNKVREGCGYRMDAGGKEREGEAERGWFRGTSG